MEQTRNQRKHAVVSYAMLGVQESFKKEVAEFNFDFIDTGFGLSISIASAFLKLFLSTLSFIKDCKDLNENEKYKWIKSI